LITPGITVLKDSDHTMAGSISGAIDSHTDVQSSGGITYIRHTTNGVSSPSTPPDPTDGTWWGEPDGPVAWIFQWTAPAQGAGSVTFYGSTVAANGDGGADGSDNAYTPTMTLTEGSPAR
jgi:hypothetical protein